MTIVMPEESLSSVMSCADCWVYPTVIDLCNTCMLQKFVEQAYTEFLSGKDDHIEPLLQDLEKKVGKLLALSCSIGLIVVHSPQFLTYIFRSGTDLISLLFFFLFGQPLQKAQGSIITNWIWVIFGRMYLAGLFLE